MPCGTTTDRPYLTPGESGMGGELAASAIHEFSHRPPEGHVGANCAATSSSPPDNLWFVRLADWTTASRTKPRSGGSQPADGGTIFFEEVEEFAAEFQSDTRLGLQSSGAEPERERQVVLWMRSGDPTLRAATIGGTSPQKATKIKPEKIEPIEELDFEGYQEFPEPTRPTAQDTACPLLVWTLWTNPLSQ
jgi:Sigma-54 interaction domain